MKKVMANRIAKGNISLRIKLKNKLCTFSSYYVRHKIYKSRANIILHQIHLKD